MSLTTPSMQRVFTRKIATPLCLLASSLFAQTPTLPRIDAMPPSVPYHWQNVVIRGGGFVSGVIFSSSQHGLVYARTDVGGAYRSIDAGQTWTPLTDRFGRDDATYLGIESIALNPQDPAKLYIAAGMYSADWGGPSAIFRSNDRGATFEKSPMPFKMGGNDNGRGVGERLAVDPNLGSVLYFGSRKAGLWKSVDSGVTWKHVDAFPVQTTVTGVGEKTGITFVVFDSSSGSKGSASKTIYAGVAQPGSGLYRSRDAGASWQAVTGAPGNLFPNHGIVVPGAGVYFSYVDNIGPNGILDGAIFKLSANDDKWKDITPLKPGVPGGQKFGYGGIAVDAQHPETIMVTTIDRWYPDNLIFRTTDGGKKWKDVFATAQASALTTPWVYWHRTTTGGHGWMSSIGIDPFDSNKVMYTTGEGIWGSADVTAVDAGKPTHWGFADEGLEETVPDGIVSPPQGAHLVSVIGDIAGFHHEDITKSPANGFFTDPMLYSNSGIDFAALNPMLMVRVGYGDPKLVRGGYSLDNGTTWKPFGTEPASSKKGGGRIAISADGKIVVWSPDGGAPAWSNDWGKSWHPCGGLTEKMRAVSDRVNPQKFYSFNEETGQFLESLSGPQSFALRTEPVTKDGRHPVIAAVPGREGDIWLSLDGKVFHSADSGVTFVPLPGMESVHTIGFGMPSPGKTQPAIYMNGSVQKTEGTLRSVDGGMSWVRVDDPQHQFGWKNAITGDPRVFGRLYLATGGRGIVYGDPVSGSSVGAGQR